MKCILLLLSLFIIVKTNVHAQPKPLELSINYIHPRNSDGSSFLNAGGGFILPIHRFQQKMLVAGINYAYYGNNLPSDSISIKNLHKIAVPILMLWKLNNNYKLSIIFAPSFSSDYIRFSANNFCFNSAVRIAHTSSTGVTNSFGIGMSKQFYGFQVSPFYQAVIPLGSRLILSGVLPLKPNLTWVINKDNQIGTTIMANTSSFRLSESKGERYVDTKQAELGFFYQKRIVGNIFVRGTIGYSFLNSIKVFEKDQVVPLRIFLYDFGNTRQALASWNERGVGIQLQIFYSLDSGIQ